MSELPPGLIMVLGALAMPFLGRGQVWKIASLLIPLVTLAAVWTFPAGQEIHANFLDFDLTLAKVNPPTRAFGTIFAVMAFAGALFAYNQDRWVELPAALLYAGSAIGVTFAGDLFTILVFWELMAVGSTVVVWAANTEGSRKAGRRYVNVHLVGGVIFMAGIILHVYESGGGSAALALPDLQMGATLDDPVSRSPWADLDTPQAWLMLIGILVNAGTPPFGSWLPDAYPEASESGTVFLSAFTTKTSVYVLIVMFAGCEILIYAGAAMAVYGIVYAILENDMRRILAYSIVNQVGFMVCAVGLGTGLSINGATAHAFAHIIYKALLLMSAGSVLYMTGKRKCTDLGGLYRTMPITMVCGTIGALAISAVPLTSGFTTKSMITDAAAHGHHALAWFVLVAASAGVFLHAGIKFPWFVFFQKDSGLRPKDPPGNMKAAMVLFSVLCIALGVMPGPLYEILPFAQDFFAKNPGQPLYEAFSGAHVVSQLQLLLFSGLAFFVLLPLLKRTLTITLDFDWLYRKFVPALWLQVLRPTLRMLEPLHQGIVKGLPRTAAAQFGAPDHDGAQRPWGVGQTVLLLTVFLALFLFVNLFVE